MPSIYNCWVCDAKLKEYNKEYPFHCSENCKKKCKFENYKPGESKKDIESVVEIETKEEVKDGNRIEGNDGNKDGDKEKERRKKEFFENLKAKNKRN